MQSLQYVMYPFLPLQKDRIGVKGGSKQTARNVPCRDSPLPRSDIP